MGATIQRAKGDTNLHKGPSIRWLHLSDVHIQPPHNIAAQDNQAELVDKALRFIGDKVQEGVHPDFVFVTGDLAYSGTEADYTDGDGLTVRSFLDRLCKAAQIDKSCLFVVPGNHDTNRSTIMRMCAREDIALAKEAVESEHPDKICDKMVFRLFSQASNEREERDVLLKRHKAYVQFCRDYFDDDRYPEPKDSAEHPSLSVLCYNRHLKVPRNGFSFGLAGLCTTWTSQSRWRASENGDQDAENSQFICVKTIRDAIQALQEDRFRLALFHHPPEWLVEPERDRLHQEQHLFTEFDFVLTGHTHKAEKLWNPPQQGLRAFRSSAGAIFSGRSHCNAFNFVEVWPESGYGHRMVVTWNPAKGGWFCDPIRTESANADPFWQPFNLPTRGTDTSKSAFSGIKSAADLKAYCRNIHDQAVIVLTASDGRHRCLVDQLYVEMEVESAESRPQDSKHRAVLETKDRGVDTDGKRMHAPLPADRNDEEQPRSRTVRQVLPEAVGTSSLAILVGGPGTGKTTTLQWLALRAAEQHLSGSASERGQNLEWLAGLVPIPLTAKYLHEWHVQATKVGQDTDLPPTRESLYAYLRAESEANRMVTSAEACARDALEQNRGLLLVDGLDEISGAARRRIIHLLGLFRGNRIIFSARPGGFDAEEHEPDCRPFHIARFDRPRIEAYLDLWFAYRRQWSEKPIPDHEIRDRRRELLNALDRSLPICDLAGIPLFAVQHGNHARGGSTFTRKSGRPVQ